MPRSEFVRTRFYKEWVQPQGTLAALSVNLEKGLTRTSMINVRMTVPLREEMRYRLRLLVPHLQRAVAIGRLFDQSKGTEQALTKTLDNVEAAVFLVSAHAEIIFANDNAKRMLADGTLVRKEGNTLDAVAPDADHTLRGIFVSAEKGRRLGWSARRCSTAHGCVEWAMVCSCSTADVWKATASRQQLCSRCRCVYPQDPAERPIPAGRDR